MSRRKETGVDWLYNGHSTVIHALPSDRAHSKDPFVALCGYHSGAWNGGDYVFKNGKPGERFELCVHCKRLAPHYTARVKKERQQKWERWSASKTRAKLMGKIVKMIEKMGKAPLLHTLDSIKEIDNDDWE